MTIYKLTVTRLADHATLAIGSSAKKTKGEAYRLIYKDPETIVDFLGDQEIEMGWINKAWKFVDQNGSVKAIASWGIDSEANYKKNLKIHEESMAARKAYDRLAARKA